MVIMYGSKQVCETCGSVCEPEEMSKGSNHCKECRRKKGRERSLETSKVARRTAFKALVAGIRGNKINVPHTSEVAAEMIRLYGGVDKFCSEWKADLDSLRMDKPGSKAVIDAKAAVLKLIVDSTSQRDSAPDLAGMSDDDLEKEFAGMAAVLLQKNPDVLVELLEQSGKTIVTETKSKAIEDGRDKPVEEPDGKRDSGEEPPSP